MPTPRTIVLAGGSGFLGGRLAQALRARGEAVVILTRGAAREVHGCPALPWDGRTAGPWKEALEGAWAVVNLAGRTVNCRHTREHRREMLESRVGSVQALGAVFPELKQPPKVWLQAGSLALYGNTGPRWCDETSPPGSDFPARLCQAWEAALEKAPARGTRKVVVRIGFVLDQGRGALSMLERLVRWQLGGTAGSGHQYVSWIHWKDMNRLWLRALDDPGLEGPFNACSPEPVTNRELMAALRKALRRPWSPPAPSLLVRIGAWLLGTEGSLALEGRRCTPRRLLEAGFEFEFPRLEAALADLYGNGRRPPGSSG